jgi:CheY-like chemotaxis protein
MISDVAMPRMNGRALAECMNRRYPGVPIFSCPGTPPLVNLLARPTARGFENGYTCLHKPFEPQELLRAITTAFKSVTKLKASTGLA